MPLLKSAEQPSQPVEATSRVSSPPPAGNLEMGQVPFEAYRYFGVNPGTVDKDDLKQIKDVYDWANKDSHGLGDSLFKLRQLETKLGQPPIGETRYSKMWNYVRMSKMVSTLEADRERQIKKVTLAREAEIKRIKAEEAKKVAELEKRRKEEENAIRKAREKELNQIRKLRQAYS